MQISGNGLYQNNSSLYNNKVSSETMDLRSFHEKTGNITLTTDEGDVVTFQQSSLAALETSSQTFSSPLARGMTFTAQSALAETMSFSVQGDLNEQELADITTLYDSLTTIAGDFFTGDYGKAMTGALNLGDLGSVASLDASFTQTQVIASQLTTHHVLPGDSNRFIEGFNRQDPLPELDETFKAQDLLSARWKQISDFLDNRSKEMNKQAIEDQKYSQHPADMMTEIASTLEQHPRLSPYAVALADKAVNEGGQQSELGPIQNQAKKQYFRDDFLRQFHNWLEV